MIPYQAIVFTMGYNRTTDFGTERKQYIGSIQDVIDSVIDNKTNADRPKRQNYWLIMNHVLYFLVCNCYKAKGPCFKYVTVGPSGDITLQAFNKQKRKTRN